jgi:hypothetical protein
MAYLKNPEITPRKKCWLVRGTGFLLLSMISHSYSITFMSLKQKLGLREGTSVLFSIGLIERIESSKSKNFQNF